MPEIVYKVVEHDGGWAYKAGDIFSETFPSHEDAHAAAERAASVQRSPGTPEAIEYQDEAGTWHVEDAGGDDRPATEVSDS